LITSVSAGFAGVSRSRRPADATSLTALPNGPIEITTFSEGSSTTSPQSTQPRTVRTLSARSNIGVPRPRYAGEERRTIDLLTRLLSDRTGRPTDDYRLELIVFVLAAVLFTATRQWVAEQGATPLGVLVDQAVTTIEPLLTALEFDSPN
jgi:hypothetical protein